MKINIRVVLIVLELIMPLLLGHHDGMVFSLHHRDMVMMPIGLMLITSLISVWAHRVVYNFQIVLGIGIQMLTVYVIHIM